MSYEDDTVGKIPILRAAMLSLGAIRAALLDIAHDNMAQEVAEVRNALDALRAIIEEETNTSEGGE